MGLAHQQTDIFFEAVVRSTKAYWLLSKYANILIVNKKYEAPE